MKEIDKFNFELYKKQSQDHDKLLKKLVRLLPTETLIEELKKRKILKIDWEDNKLKNRNI